MDNQNQNQQSQPVNSPQSEKAPLPSPPAAAQQFTPGYQVPVITSEALLKNEDMAKSTKKAFTIITIIVMIVVILLALVTFQIVKDAQRQPSKVHASTNSSSQSPLNNNGSINSQVKYCSNPVNAATVC